MIAPGMASINVQVQAFFTLRGDIGIHSLSEQRADDKRLALHDTSNHAHLLTGTQFPQPETQPTA